MEQIYTKHLFFCTNQKDPGKKCCMDGNAWEMWRHAKSTLGDAILPEGVSIRVNQAGCLGRCALGPCLVIYPEGVWYHYDTQADVDEIIQEHVLNGRPVERLLIDQPDQAD